MTDSNHSTERPKSLTQRKLRGKSVDFCWADEDASWPGMMPHSEVARVRQRLHASAWLDEENESRPAPNPTKPYAIRLG